jgi:hypothetical protein
VVKETSNAPMPKKHKIKVNEVTSTIINSIPMMAQIKNGEMFKESSWKVNRSDLTRTYIPPFQMSSNKHTRAGLGAV